MPDHLKRVAEDLCDLEATKEFLGVAKGEPCAEVARRLAAVSPGYEMAVNDCRTILGAATSESIVDAANRKMRELTRARRVRDDARSNLNEALGVIQRIREILGAGSEETPTDRWAATKDPSWSLAAKVDAVVAERDTAYGKINELQREIQKLECAKASADELTSVLKIMGASTLCVPYPMPSEQASMLRSLISDSGDTIWEIVERIRGKLPHHSGWSLAAKVDDVLHERDRLRAQVAKLEKVPRADEIQKLEENLARAQDRANELGGDLRDVLNILGLKPNAQPPSSPVHRASDLRATIGNRANTIWTTVESVMHLLGPSLELTLEDRVRAVVSERDRMRAMVVKLEEEAKATAPRLERAKVDHDLLNEIYGLLYWFGPSSSKSTFEERLLEKVYHAIALAKEAKEAQRAKSASTASDRICADELAKWRHVGMRALSIVDMIRGEASDDVAKALRDLLTHNF